jgi:N-acetylmuramoyl-L-alanine amidase
MATWIGSPNYTPGRPATPTRITLHIMAGHLTGTDRVFQQPRRQASSTYGVGGNGDVHQYVADTDTAWADGSFTSNQKSISIEHEGGLEGVPNTDACVQASAELCATIASRYGWPQLIHGQNVFLHREIPPYTHPNCPDRCPNPLRWQEIIDTANQILRGEDMPTAQEIADAVWARDLNGVRAIDRVQGTDEQLQRLVGTICATPLNGETIGNRLIAASDNSGAILQQLTQLNATMTDLLQEVKGK